MADTIQKYKDGVMTGFLKPFAPIVIDKASSATIIDIHGREYFDCFAGISVVNAGHCNLLVGVRGVSGNVVRFQPPLVITRQQIDRAIGIFTEALRSVAQPAHASA
jgi:4-aminobutyrate aminotransferase-like enzyme